MGRQRTNSNVKNQQRNSFVSLLKACKKQKDILKGAELHADISRQGLLDKNQFLGSAIIAMYARCGAFAHAQQVLRELPARDVVCWSALIAGYVQYGHGTKALDCFQQMLDEGLSPDSVTFLCLLKACGSIAALAIGEKIHVEIIKQGWLEKSAALGNALMYMYAKCGAFGKAHEVLNELPMRNTVSWSTLIVGYAEHGHGKKSLICFEHMQLEGLSPDGVTFACILKACGSVRETSQGEKVHAEIVRQGLLQKDIVLGAAVVDMYAKCGLLEKAQEVSDNLHNRNVFSWSALIAGYSQHERVEEALNCFERMHQEGFSPDSITYICILKACGSMGVVGTGNKIYVEIVRKDLLLTDVVLGTALIDMYVKCGALAKAQQVLNELPNRDIVSWSVLIIGYVERGYFEKALHSYENIKSEGLLPNMVTFMYVLKACGSIGTLDRGSILHAEIARLGALGQSITFSNAVVDMYVRCGALPKAQQVLEELPFQDAILWSKLIAAYAQHGYGQEALSCVWQMQNEGFFPDVVTLTSVLNACSHSGLPDEARRYFAKISTDYGIMLEWEHYACMVDLFSRAGHFGNAISIINSMPSLNCLSLWVALLCGCQNWENVKLGELAFKHTIQLDQKYTAAYVCMRKIYDVAGMQADIDKIESIRENDVWMMG